MTGAFSEAAGHFPEPFRLLVRETSTSTNDELRHLAENGAGDGLVLLALEQTSGRGRRGTSWFSAPGDSLAFSILLRPAEPKALWPRLALITGLAVAQALESFVPSTGIKWPNDVWIGGKKIAGILVEAGASHVVIGIGLNLNTTDFPDDLAGTATSLRLHSGVHHPGPEVLLGVIRRIAILRQTLDAGFGETIAAIRERCVLSGRHISYRTAAGPETGTVERIAEGGELLVHTAGGPQRLMQADEIRILDSDADESR